MLRSAKKTFSPVEYLAMERVAEYKSEYYDGEIFAMAGGTVDHSLIAVNLIAELGTQADSCFTRIYESVDLLTICHSPVFTGAGSVKTGIQ